MDQIDLVAQPNSSFNLVLNTWLITYLYGGHPGGFPADFLAKSASLLLVFDSVLCDKEALEADVPFEKVWLSSAIFSELRRAGIVKPISMLDHIPKDFLGHLKSSGMEEAALRDMQEAVALIKSEAKPGKRLEISPFLTYLNHYMFMALDVPNALLYDWQENHFRLKPVKLSDVAGDRSRIPSRSSNDGQQLISVVRALLPEFDLLPPLTPHAAKALQGNIFKEKAALYRWIYGDPEMTQAKYQEFRLGADFTALDKSIDDTRRFQAWANFELLMKVRSETQDVRAGVQRIISDVLSERRTIEDVQSDLLRHQGELLTYLPSQKSLKVDVGVASVGLAISLAGFLSGMVPIGLLGATISAADMIKSAYDVWENRQKRQAFESLRSKYPLTFLLRDFRGIQTKQIKKMASRDKSA